MKKQKTIQEMIADVYKRRELAHQILLECDKFLDGLIKELLKPYGKR